MNDNMTDSPLPQSRRRRRSKRIKQDDWTPDTQKDDSGGKTTRNGTQVRSKTTTTTARKKRASLALQKHGGDSSSSSGGLQALLPSLIGVLILAYGVMAKMGFRGRATVAGIDLGTTNSVVCVQAPAKGVGVIDCIPDAATHSPIVPSVVSFLEPPLRPVGPKSKTPSRLHPHPSAVVVGHAAKHRIDTHPHSTVYNAKRVLGRPTQDEAIAQLQHEVEFAIVAQEQEDSENGVVFEIPYDHGEALRVPPEQVGSYVVHHLMQMTRQFLGHDNVQQAVICVPAKFNAYQRQQTALAFQQAGITVARTLEEPTAAALAYGLHRKEGVDFILVYDFGGGTLDVSLLQVSQGGYVDVMGSDGDDRLGGADFDAAVAQYWLEEQPNAQHDGVVQAVADALHHIVQVQEEHPENQRRRTESSSLMELEQRLAETCPAVEQIPLCTASSFHTLAEQVKIQLSSQYAQQLEENNNLGEEQDMVVQATCLGLGRDPTWDPSSSSSSSSFTSVLSHFCDHLQPVTLSLSLSEYNVAVQALLDRSSLPVQRLLEELDVPIDEIDEVVLVGGTSRMPHIRALVRQALPSATLNTHIDPDLTVAYGAASVID